VGTEAWTDDHHAHSDEGTWQSETNAPTGYQSALGGFPQRQTYPSKDAHSEIKPYFPREHSWNGDEHDQSNERTWDHETQHPSGYQVTPSFVQQAASPAGEATYPSEDSHSEILRYEQREHA